MKKIFLLKFFIIGMVILGVSLKCFAQEEPQYFIYLTWRAETFSELDYKGKNLPVIDSKVYAEVQIFDKKGRKVDPDQFIFYWEVNYDSQFFDCFSHKFYEPGFGKNKICFRASKIDFGAYKIKVAIQNPGYLQRESFEIPYREPEVVILPYQKKVALKEIELKPTMNFYLKKYFFSSLENLEVRWYLNEKVSEGKPKNPFLITLEFWPEISKGEEFDLYAECFNLKSKFQRAKAGPIKIVKR